MVNVMIYGEFENLRSNLSSSGIRLKVSAPDEHVREIERFTRTINKRMRRNFNILPFKRLPQTMIIEMAKNAVFCIILFQMQKEYLM